MKPKKRARYAAAVTLSKGKMFEYGVPEGDHIELPDDLDLQMQFPLAVGTVGDFASEVVAKTIGNSIEAQSQTPLDELKSFKLLTIPCLTKNSPSIFAYLQLLVFILAMYPEMLQSNYLN